MKYNQGLRNLKILYSAVAIIIGTVLLLIAWLLQITNHTGGTESATSSVDNNTVQVVVCLTLGLVFVLAPAGIWLILKILRRKYE